MLRAHDFLVAPSAMEAANTSGLQQSGGRESSLNSKLLISPQAQREVGSRPISRAGSADSQMSHVSEKKPRNRQAAYWSYLLGCMVNVDRGPKKHDLDIFCYQFVLYMKMEKGLGKKEWHARLPVFFKLLLRTGQIDCNMPIERSVRKPVVEERRLYLFSPDQSTSILKGEAKRLRFEIKLANDKINEANVLMTKIQQEDDARRAKEESVRAEEEMMKAIRRARGLDPQLTGERLSRTPTPKDPLKAYIPANPGDQSGAGCQNTNQALPVPCAFCLVQ